MTTTTGLILSQNDFDAMTDHDAVSQHVFNQTLNGDTGALATHETFDWQVIEADHTEIARQHLAALGVHWDPDTGEIRCPAGMDADQAAAAWDSARDDADEHVLLMIEEIRKGKPEDEDDERTAGGVWVTSF